MTFNRFFFNNFFFRIEKQNKIIVYYFFIMFGFFIGNLCGSFFNILPLSTFCIIIGIVFFLEVFTFIYYKFILFYQKPPNIKQTIFFLHTTTIANSKLLSKKKRFKRILPLKLLYFLKIGFLFGLFVDAFKVGS